MGQIVKIVSFSERGSLTENNGTINKVQLLMVMEKFNIFKNFKKLLMGGYDKKLKNFPKSKKKSVIFTNQTILRQKFFLKKNFQIEDSKCHFSTDFKQKWKYFLIDRANLTRFSETRSLSDQNCMLKIFCFLKVTEVIDVKK